MSDVVAAADSGTCWAFLHARNRVVDYSFALLPAFLIRDKAAQSRLGTRFDPGAAQFLAAATRTNGEARATFKYLDCHELSSAADVPPSGVGAQRMATQGEHDC